MAKKNKLKEQAKFFFWISGMARIQKNQTSKKMVTVGVGRCCHLVAFVAIVMPVLIFGCGLDPVLFGYLVLVLGP